MPDADRADYAVSAESTATFGRVLLSARDQHLVVDGPTQNGCPGEALTPAELFLGGVATCAVELVQVLARQSGVPLAGVAARASGVIDRGHDLRSDVTIFSSAVLHFRFRGIGDGDAARLVESFKGR